MTERIDTSHASCPTQSVGQQPQPMDETAVCLASACQADTLRRRAVVVLMAVIAIAVVTLDVGPARAAIVLDFFDVSVAPDRVTLEWATLSEFNIEGFNIYCKEAQEPPSAYHIIGTEVAQGSADVGHFYSFPVTVLDPGVAYCFRIEEITVDGTAPEQFERCGYGLNILPTPTMPAGQGAGVVENTPQTPDALQEGIQSDATSTPATLRSSPDQPTPTPVVLSPLGAGAPATVSTVQSANDSLASGPADNLAANNAATSPLTPPTTDAAAANANNGPPTPEGTAQDSMAATVTPVQDFGSTGALNQDLPQNVAQAPGLPTPLYIVMTATPTTEADALALAPTLTPLPTATAASATLIAALTEVNAENILLAMLCFVFVGGSGLGILGITSLGLYLRSRSDNRTSGSVSTRRR